jgi:hypothetical protein
MYVRSFKDLFSWKGEPAEWTPQGEGPLPLMVVGYSEGPSKPKLRQLVPRTRTVP